MQCSTSKDLLPPSYGILISRSGSLSLSRALESIRDDEYGFPFANPVDVTVFTDYPHFVSHPMDISTVLDYRYKQNYYTSVQQFIGK